MKVLTVSEVSKAYNISTRMLRYYEKAGLISSIRKENYAYRVYDETAVKYLQMIIAMRKLQIPLKQISVMLNNSDNSQISNILHQNMTVLESEINKMVKIKNIMNAIVTKVDHGIQEKEDYDIFEDEKLLHRFDTLNLEKNKITSCYKDNIEDFEMFEEKITVRIILIPPCTVASYQYIGEMAEEITGDVMDGFIRETNLYEKKPDARMFGFDHPSVYKSIETHGYENWVTIPDDLNVTKPLVKKNFKGGLYAAYTIDFPNFNEKEILKRWIDKSNIYCADYYKMNEEDIDGCLEEYLNWVYSSHMGWPENGIDGKVDLLIPIKRIN